MEAQDVELVARARDGDEEAARILFDRHAPALRARVRRMLPRLVKGKLGESDVLQEAYLTAYLKLADFEDRGEGSFARWVARILDNKLRHEARRFLRAEKRSAKREVRLTESPGGPKAEHRARGPATEASVQDDRARVRGQLEDLSESDRQILTLVHEASLGFKEIGERLGITSDAARMRYGRALARMAERMSTEDPS